MKFLPLFALALMLSALSAHAQFQLIDVNFYSEFYQGSKAEGAAVVGNSTDVWNGINADPKSGGPIALSDSNGNPTPVTLSYRAYGAVVSGADNIQPNPNLMSNYLFNKKGDKITVTLQNLVPNRTYNLYLYTASNDGGKSSRAATLTVNGIGLKATGDPQTSFMMGSNYVQLTVPADHQGKIEIIETPSPESTGGREVDLNGLQIAAAQ